MIDAELRLFLLGLPGVAAVAGARVYPAELPEDVVLPAVVLTQVTEAPTDSNSGSSHTEMLYQVDSYAGTLAEARALDRGIRTALKGRRNRMGGYTAVSFLSNVTVYRLSDEDEWRVSSDYAIQVTG